ncbi:MAG: hypothetical protein QG572_1965 [Pseudomonadota bacterium]|nr:hypothetical protein [Pseudomonadota bacterium]
MLGATHRPTFIKFLSALLDGFNALTAFGVDLLPDFFMQVLETVIQTCGAKEGGNR